MSKLKSFLFIGVVRLFNYNNHQNPEPKKYLKVKAIITVIFELIRAKVLNKTVILHLSKLLGGTDTSAHIAQIAIGYGIIFSDFD